MYMRLDFFELSLVLTIDNTSLVAYKLQLFREAHNLFYIFQSCHNIDIFSRVAALLYSSSG